MSTEAVRLYRPAEAAEVLGISRASVYRIIHQGAIRVVELGTTSHKQRIRADDLQAFIDARTYGAN